MFDDSYQSLIIAAAMLLLLGACGEGQSLDGSAWITQSCETVSDCRGGYLCSPAGRCVAEDAVVGAQPQHDPENHGLSPIVSVRGRGAGTCTLTRGGASLGGDVMPRAYSETISYDAAGRPVESHNGPWGAHYWTYDSSGWLASMTAYRDSERSDLKKETLYTRNAAHQVTSKSVLGRDESGATTEKHSRYEYDAIGRLSRWVFDQDGDVRDVPIAWGEDGLSRTDYDAPCGPADARRLFLPDGRRAGWDWPNCEVFGTPDTYWADEYDDSGRWAALVKLSRDTSENDERILLDSATYEQDRLVQTTRGGTAGIHDGVGVLDIEWDGDYMSRLTLNDVDNDRVYEETQLEGECLFDVHHLRLAYTFFGSYF